LWEGYEEVALRQPHPRYKLIKFADRDRELEPGAWLFLRIHVACYTAEICDADKRGKRIASLHPQPTGLRCPAAAAAGPPPGADRPLDHKVALITGANTGIGFQTAKALLRRDYQVVLACRDKAKAEAARAKLRHAAAALLSALRDPASSSTSTPVLYLCMSV
jgi:hypothetical protein